MISIEIHNIGYIEGGDGGGGGGGDCRSTMTAAQTTRMSKWDTCTGKYTRAQRRKHTQAKKYICIYTLWHLVLFFFPLLLLLLLLLFSPQNQTKWFIEATFFSLFAFFTGLVGRFSIWFFLFLTRNFHFIWTKQKTHSEDQMHWTETHWFSFFFFTFCFLLFTLPRICFLFLMMICFCQTFITHTHIPTEKRNRKEITV